MISETLLAAKANSGNRRFQAGSMSSGYSNRTRRTGRRAVFTKSYRSSGPRDEAGSGRSVLADETERRIDAGLGLLVVDAPRHRQLGDEHVAGVGLHRLLGGRERGVALADGQVANDLGVLVDVARLELLLVVLEPARPVRGDAGVGDG